MAQLKLQSTFRSTTSRDFSGDIEDENDSFQEKWTIELKRGNPTVYKEDRNNSITTTKTYGIFILPYALLTNFKNVGSLFFLAVTLIMLIDPGLSPYLRWIMAFPLLIFMIIHCAKVFAIAYIRRKEDNKVNNLSTRRAKPTGEIEENVKWMNLKPGDIIHLKKEETCPADIILLDSSLPKNRDMICWLNTQAVDGFSDLTMKKAALATKVDNGSTRKGNYPEYRKLLSGKIEYDPPNAHYKSFSGYIKLKKDPRAEPITLENFIPRGSIIKNTEWIYGICAYTGNDTKMMYRSNRPITKGNYFDDLAEKYFLFGIFVVLLLSAICIIIFVSQRTASRLSYNLLGFEYPNGLDGKYFFSDVILHSPLIPIAFYAIFDLIMAFRAVSLEKKYNKQKNNPEIKILDPSALPSLGHVDYCLIDKSGTLTTANYKIKDVYTKSRAYKVDLEILKQKSKSMKGTSGFTFMQTLSDRGHKGNIPTMQEVEEEGIHLQMSSPTKAYKFKDELESKIRLTSPDRLNTSSSPINKNSAATDNFLYHKRSKTETGSALTPLAQRNEHNDLLLLTENDDHNKEQIYFDTQQSEHRSILPKKNQDIEMTPKDARAHTDHGVIKIEEEHEIPSPKRNETSFGKTPRSATMQDDLNFLKVKHNENQYLTDCYRSNDQDLDQFLRCLALCHAARSKYTEEKYIYESSQPEDVPLLELGAISGKSFMVSNRPDNPSKYTIFENEKAHDYKILGVNDFSYGRKKFSIVARTDDQHPAMIFAKGTAMGMKSALQLEDYEMVYYDTLVNKLKNKGYKVIVLAGRELENEEADNFYKKYQSYKMSLYSQTDELEALAKEVETRLKLIGIVALEDELRPGAADMIQTFKDADIKTWMVTGDNQEKALNICYQIRLINQETEVYSFTFDSIDNAKALIRTTLNNIKKHYSEGAEEESPTGKISGFKTLYDKKYDFCVTIDGDSLDLVFRDPYLTANFTFVCALAGSVIGYRLSAANKKALISMIKKGFKGAPTVLAIGDGHKDKLMLERADISFELRANKDTIPCNAGDIQISSLDVIKDLLLVEGRNISDKTEKTLNFMFYKAFVLGIPIFIFNLDSGSTAAPLFDSMLVFLYSFLFTFVPTLIYAVCDKGEPSEILLGFPALYLDGKIKKGRAMLSFLVHCLVEGVIHGVVIYEIVTYSIHVTLGKQGFISDLGVSSLAQFYALVTIINLKLYGNYKTKKGIWLASTVLSLLILLVYIFINDAAQFVASDYQRQTQALFEMGGSVLSMFFVTVFCGMFSRLVKYVLAERLFRSWYNYYATKEDDVEHLTNNDILKSAVPPKDLGTIVKAAFKQTEYVDPVVQQMLHPADESLNEFGIKPWSLKFVDLRMERQYKNIMSKVVGQKFKIIYWILLIVFAGYIIGESVINEEASYTFSRLGVFIFFAVLGVSLLTPIYKQYYFEVTFLFVVCAVAAKIAFDWTRENDSSLAASLIPAAISIVFNAYAFWMFVLNLVYYAVYLARLIVLYTTNDVVEDLGQETAFIEFYSIWSFALLLGGITVLLSILTYKFEKHQRSEYLANTKVGLQLTKSNDILSILLPKFIKEKIDRLGDDKSLAEDQGEVTILFCDIMDFDKIIQYEGKNLVQILDHVFRAFDQLCGTYGVQKIETVGKTYMACAGLKSCEIGIAKEVLAVHPSRRILNLALDMEEFVKKVTYSNGIPMKLRIGVHYGRVIAGVIGYHKPQFSLIGDAVNTTSRVCTSKNPGQIRMSNEAYTKMMEAGGAGRSEIYFIPKTEEMKGKGDVKIHIVARKATSTGFKKKIANAVKLNKDKQVFNVDENLGETSKKNIANTNMFKDIKGNILLNKDKIAEELRKAESQNSLDEKNGADNLDDNDSDLGDEEQDVALLKPNRFTLKFSSTANNRIIVDFEEKLGNTQKTFGIRSIMALILIYLIQTGLFIAIDNQTPGAFVNGTAIIVLRFIFAFAMCLLLVFNNTLIKKKIRQPITLSVFMYGTLITILHGAWTRNIVYQYIQGIELMLIDAIAIHSGGLNFMNSLNLTGSMTIAFFAAFGANDILRTRIIFFFCVFAITTLIHKYVKLTEEIKFYNNLRLRERKKIEQSRLVGQLLPLHAAEIYFSDPTGRVDVSDEFHDVTILYADIKGFTDYSAEVEPKDVVTMLSALFTRFDKVCVKYSLYKVYTIGDCYVALSFFDASRRNPGKEVNNMVQMALSMIGIIREVRREINFEGLDMRIGLHTGTIIGGIVGTDIIRYDVWGKDALIANAMESEGVKGNINVSESTMHLLEATSPGLYRFEPHKIVEMEKIQAKVPCYLLYANDNMGE